MVVCGVDPAVAFDAAGEGRSVVGLVRCRGQATVPAWEEPLPVAA